MVLKFQRNRTKPELIRFFFLHLAPRLRRQRKWQSSRATQKYEHNTKQRFGQKKSRILPESWKLNGNIFFELFLSDLDEKMTSAGYKRHKKENSKTSSVKPIISHLVAFRTQNENTA